MPAIYRLNNPLDVRFASFDCEESGGEWLGRCRRCGRYSRHVPGTLLCRWTAHAGRRLVGDFVWGWDSLLARRQVAATLADEFPGISSREIAIEGRRRLLGDEDLVQVVVSSEFSVSALPGSTLREMSPRCERCGEGGVSVSGVEDVRPVRRGESWKKVPRKKGAGLLVKKSELAKIGLFCWNWNCFLGTSAVRKLARAHAWSNVAFREWGETVPW